MYILHHRRGTRCNRSVRASSPFPLPCRATEEALPPARRRSHLRSTHRTRPRTRRTPLPERNSDHRAIGKGYLAAWLGIALSGFALGAKNPGLSAFEVLTLIGLVLVTLGYGAVLLRRRVGRNWLNYHYRFMTASLAALIVAGTNQTLTQTVGSYPRWLFWVLVISPFLVLPAPQRRVEVRFPNARRTMAARPNPVNQPWS